MEVGAGALGWCDALLIGDAEFDVLLLSPSILVPHENYPSRASICAPHIPLVPPENLTITFRSLDATAEARLSGL